MHIELCTDAHELVCCACLQRLRASEYAAETSTLCVQGLWQRPLCQFLSFLVSEKFNAIRVSISAELALNLDGLEPNGIVFDANPELQARHPYIYFRDQMRCEYSAPCSPA